MNRLRNKFILFKYYFQDEQDRIRALGGFVEFTDAYRVNGFISVARAIGESSSI
jgi:hypothetical protein